MNEETKEKENEKVQANVQFRSGGTTIAVAGVIGGAGIALGLPLIVLVYGQSLGSTLLTIFVITALLIGGTVALASAVLGLVIPQQVNGAGHGPWGRHAWKRWARHHCCGEPEGDWRHWGEQDWKDWVEKKKEE
jgi:hypothetical protein